VHDLREKAGLSQSDLAKRVGTKQPNISRLENGEVAGLPSLDLLGRVASALDGRLEVRIVRPRKAASRKGAARKRKAARRG
jgi:transcriptional regulator with XRE-family HTH domain